MARSIRGIRDSIPPGHVIGRRPGGRGPGRAELLTMAEAAAFGGGGGAGAGGGGGSSVVVPVAGSGGAGMLPLVTGETVPFISATGTPVLQPMFVITPDHQCIGVPL